MSTFHKVCGRLKPKPIEVALLILFFIMVVLMLIYGGPNASSQIMP